MSKAADDALRLQVAKLCGWTQIQPPETAFERKLCHMWEADLMGRDATGCAAPVPNYATDLNAMHKAEHLVRRDEQTNSRYERHLRAVMAAADAGRCNRRIQFAEARERAQAFVLAMGDKAT